MSDAEPEPDVDTAGAARAAEIAIGDEDWHRAEEALLAALSGVRKRKNGGDS